MTTPYTPKRSGEYAYNHQTTVASADVPSGASGAPNGEYFADMVHVVNQNEFTLSGDITLGAVEIKDGDSDVRVDVETYGSQNAIINHAVDSSGTSIDDYAGLYQNTIFTNQLTLSGATQSQITSSPNRGYLKLRISSGGFAYIGDSTVLSGTGYLLDDSYPVETLTFDDLSLVHVVGSGTLYTIGGYIS